MGLLPGATDYDTKKSTKKVIVVLDSSGSRWDDRNFKLGMAVAHWYEQRHMLTALYCCDTELAKVEFGQKKSQIRGGGGTEFGKRHIKQLTDKHGEDYAIVYLTDGDLDLSDARVQKTVFIVDIVKEVEVA
jgi:predicted metal-dependent peptidase